MTFALVDVPVRIEDMPLSPTLLAHVARTDTVEDAEDDDYSASVSALLQRRPSRRSSRRKKRGSSPFLSDDPADLPGSSRRRSSVFTTSSGEYVNWWDGINGSFVGIHCLDFWEISCKCSRMEIEIGLESFFHKY